MKKREKLLGHGRLYWWLYDNDFDFLLDWRYWLAVTIAGIFAAVFNLWLDYFAG